MYKVSEEVKAIYKILLPDQRGSGRGGNRNQERAGDRQTNNQQNARGQENNQQRNNKNGEH